eukprot:CAMPEP_0178579534 /NCGR_PEP_ID=MMETSP0697-20121206/22132_1 /TAXON_ID=265572 /ORGANISM="Extubocellulus spinifer, Strain CCMP396" /LENGTH=74 /DNA_ID=CAMNT_0020214985 /DNA_START=55 /DNA_END=280 /DNA_ORIENTATION=-
MSALLIGDVGIIDGPKAQVVMMVVQEVAALDGVDFIVLKGMNRLEIFNQNIVDDAERLITIGFFLDMVVVSSNE